MLTFYIWHHFYPAGHYGPALFSPICPLVSLDPRRQSMIEQVTTAANWLL